MEPTCELYDNATGLASAGLTATTYDAPSNVAPVTLGALGETAVKAVACPKDPNELDPSDALAGEVCFRAHTHTHTHTNALALALARTT